MAYLLLLLFHGKDSVLKLELPKLQQPPKGILLLFLGLLLLNIGAVLHWFDKLWALLLTAGVVALCDWRRLREVDYNLLVTFAGSYMDVVSAFVKDKNVSKEELDQLLRELQEKP